MVTREPDEGSDKEYDGLESAMRELAGHLKSSDWAAAADCFRSAMQIADSEPLDQLPEEPE